MFCDFMFFFIMLTNTTTENLSGQWEAIKFQKKRPTFCYKNIQQKKKKKKKKKTRIAHRIPRL